MLAEMRPITSDAIERKAPLDAFVPPGPREKAGLRELPGALLVFRSFPSRFLCFAGLSRACHGRSAPANWVRLFQLMAP